MSLDPSQQTSRNLALTLAQGALQRQTQLLSALGSTEGQAAGGQTSADAGPTLTEPVALSAQAREQLARSASATLTALAASKPTGPMPAWPAQGVDDSTHALVHTLLRQFQGPTAAPWKLMSVQAWPNELWQHLNHPTAEDPASAATPTVRGLQTWLVQQGLLQTPAGPQSLLASLSVPAAWLEQQQAAQASAPPAPAPRLLVLPDTATTPRAGLYALLLETAEQERTSALLSLELGSARPSVLYGRDMFTPRSDPWQQQAVLLASGMVPRTAARQGDGPPDLCRSPDCPYQGRAACPQPFCPDVLTIAPV